MTDSLVVIMEGSVVGTLVRSGGGRLRFDYDEGHRTQLHASPLSLSMPTQIRSHPDAVITPWLWGLLPDNDLVLSRWAREFHVSASSPFSLLSTPIGRDCAGAVQFVSSSEVEAVLKGSGHVTWLSEDDVAQRLRELRQDSTAWLGKNFSGQFSLAGAQAKTALLFKDGRWGVPSGSTPTTHILKPAVAGLDDHDLNEHLCLDAARRAGLLAVRTSVHHFGEESAVIVERYDRFLREDQVVRIHQEDFCQALGVVPSKKYQNEGGPGPLDMVELLRGAMSQSVAEAAVGHFVDALIWNWLIAGTDAHAKNYSLLLAGDEIRLAPLYDVASALPYGAHEKKLRLAMKIGDDYEVYPARNNWPKLSRQLGLDADALRDRVLELGRIAPDAFAEAASRPDVRALRRPITSELVHLVAERASRCVQLMNNSGPSN